MCRSLYSAGCSGEVPLQQLTSLSYASGMISWTAPLCRHAAKGQSEIIVLAWCTLFYSATLQFQPLHGAACPTGSQSSHLFVSSSIPRDVSAVVGFLLHHRDSEITTELKMILATWVTRRPKDNEVIHIVQDSINSFFLQHLPKGICKRIKNLWS